MLREWRPNTIEDLEPAWLRDFAGMTTLAPFIYDQQKNNYRSAYVRALEDFSQRYQDYKSHEQDESFERTKRECDVLLKISKLFFNEWYHSMLSYSDSFKIKYNT